VDIPAKKPTIINIHFNIFFKAKPIAYPTRPEPANGIRFDNNNSELIFLLLRMF
jgi:hypothetical protein